MAETAHTHEEGAHHGHGGHGGGHGAEHEKHYWKIYWALLVLFGISVAGPFVGDATGIAAITMITAFGIAVAKAALVVRNFMHLTLEPKFVFYISATAVVLMGLFFFWVAPDVMKHEGHQWVNVAAMAASGEARVVDEGPFDPQTTFETVCAPCHGMTGAGDGPAAAALDPRPAAFASPEFWETRDRAHVINVVTNGGPAVGKSPLMPSFGATYTAEQIAALADHVVSLGPDQPAEAAAPDAGVAVPATPDAGAVQPADAGAAVPEVAEVAPPPAPVGPSEAEKAQRASWITQRLYR